MLENNSLIICFHRYTWELTIGNWGNGVNLYFSERHFKRTLNTMTRKWIRLGLSLLMLHWSWVFLSVLILLSLCASVLLINLTCQHGFPMPKTKIFFFSLCSLGHWSSFFPPETCTITIASCKCDGKILLLLPGFGSVTHFFRLGGRFSCRENRPRPANECRLCFLLGIV